MNTKQISSFIAALIFFSIISIDFAFSACVTNTQGEQIFSGNTELKEISGSDGISIRGDLSSYPLKIIYQFDNDETGCYVKEDLLFRLTPTGSYTEFDSLVETNEGGVYTTTAQKTITTNFVFSGTITSSFQITNKYAESSSLDILFNIDDIAPSVIVDFNPIKDLYKKDDIVDFTIDVSDSGSGLASLTISGGTQSINIYDGNESDNLIYSDSLVSSGNYSFTVTDLLGNTVVKEIKFLVDDDEPTISGLDYESSYRDLSDYYIFQVKVTDSSYELGKDISVVGDFSQVNPSATSLIPTSCVLIENSLDTKLCTFPEIKSTLSDSETINPIITATDSSGHETIETLTTNLDIDITKPEILRFEVVNSLGVSNVFRSGDNLTLFLEVRDDSIKDENTFRKIENFGLIAFPPSNPVCSKTDTVIKCEYDITGEAGAYAGFGLKNDNFTIKVYDDRDNMEEGRIPVLIDNFLPVIERVELIETTCLGGNGICDGIVSSGETINFKIYIKEDNLFFGNENFVYGDFSDVDFRTGQEKVEASCRNYDSETVECSFNGIEVENGYLDRTVDFVVRDVAGNTKVETFPIEIFAVGDEVVSSYSIDDLKILNPINRNVMKSAGSKTWFKGSLESSDSNMVLVNYQWLSCNYSQLNPFLIVPTNTGLFPNEVVINSGQDNPQDFNLLIELAKHPSAADMNNKKVGCEMSVLKRDSTTLFAPEIVDFNVEFEFYGDLTGDILRAHATDIMSDIEDAEALGSWFDTTFEIYNVLNSVCSAVNTGSSLLLGVSNVVYGTQWLMAPLLPLDGGSMASAIGTASYAPTAAFGGILNSGPIKKMCDAVTCRNGGLLTGALLGTNLGEGAQDLYNSMNEAVSSICIAGDTVEQVNSGGANEE